VFSYTTSPAYHVIAENKDHIKAAAFAEGHYLQIEVAGKMAASRQPQLAERFLQFMVSERFQQHIPTGNWMYPVLELKEGLPAAFAELVQPSKALLFSPAEVYANRRQWILDWLGAMSR
jgi:thiamine transport system substrate-binding protein